MHIFIYQPAIDTAIEMLRVGTQLGTTIQAPTTHPCSDPDFFLESIFVHMRVQNPMHSRLSHNP